MTSRSLYAASSSCTSARHWSRAAELSPAATPQLRWFQPQNDLADEGGQARSQGRRS